MTCKQVWSWQNIKPHRIRYLRYSNVCIFYSNLSHKSSKRKYWKSLTRAEQSMSKSTLTCGKHHEYKTIHNFWFPKMTWITAWTITTIVWRRQRSNTWQQKHFIQVCCWSRVGCTLCHHDIERVPCLREPISNQTSSSATTENYLQHLYVYIYTCKFRS